jgi:thioredoxin 1
MAIILNDSNFEEETKEGVFLVDFYADWCGPCRIAEPMINELSDEIGMGANVVKVNVDESPETSMKYMIRSIPTFIVLKDGKVVEQMSGLFPKDTLKEKTIKYI